MTQSRFPLPPAEHHSAFCHFAKRVHERVGRDQDARAHWWRIITAINSSNLEVVEFMGRQKIKHRKIWRYHIPGVDRPIFVIFDHMAGIPITLLINDRPMACGSRGQRMIIDGVIHGL